ncbi:MAG TPA: TonB-dependent receptor [Bryobacteraceae bacterium]|nr:TonB-dependent receptor [Bryobacteraceae bacterium]
MNRKLAKEAGPRTPFARKRAMIVGATRGFSRIASWARVACIVGSLSIPAFAQPEVGLVGGVTRDSSSGKPVPGAQIIAHSLNKGTDQSTVTGADGIFTFTKLEPGLYEIAATKEGFRNSSTHVEVSVRKIARVELPLTIAEDLPRATLKPDDAPLTERERQMLLRIERLEARLEAMAAANTNVGAEPLVASLTPAASAAPASFPQTSRSSIVPPPAPVAPPDHRLPEALQAPDPRPAVDTETPFAYGDFTWLNGSPRNKDTVLDTKFFTPEIRFDTHYMEDFNQPKDHTIVGSTESFRSGEVQIEQASVGGDFHWQGVRGRILFMEGLFATTTPRNDASAGVGNWDLRAAYKYVSEAYGGYHFNVNHGLNVDAGIFVSYIGLFSYYNFDNWGYQPSYVSSNTPWFFNGVRVQWFPTAKLKIEPWFINGWQSYAKYNGHPGLGGQILWLPKEWLKVVGNQYGFGQDNLGLPHTERIHTDDSVEIRFYNNQTKDRGISKIAMSLTGDAGAQYGGGLCGTCAPSKGKESFVGWMLYNRYWWNKDKYAITFGGGQMSNYGRYLTLLPPINGADAVTGSPYFTELPGQKAHMWDSSINLQYMPRQYITWWAELGYRHSDVPYFAGRGGVTPPGFPLGGTNGAPGQFACMNGAPSGATDLPTATSNCGSVGGVWFPDLRRSEAKFSVGVMVKF